MPNGQPNPRLRFLSHIGRHFRALTHDGEPFAAELFFNHLDGTGGLSLIVRRAEPLSESAATTEGGNHD